MSKWSVVVLLWVMSFCAKADAQEIVKDTYYGSLTTQRLDVYPSLNSNSPIILMIHGGAWYGGSKTDMATLAQYYQSKGYTVASVKYRLSWQATFPANIEDVGCALAFIRKNAQTFNGDPKRIALLGYSAGAHLAALQGIRRGAFAVCEPTTDYHVDAVIGISGIYDFKYNHSWEPNRLHQMLGDTAKYLVAAQPSSHLDSLDNAEWLLLTAVPDYIVPEQITFEFSDSLVKRGVSVWERHFYTKDHTTIMSSVNAEDSVISAIDEFLIHLWGERSVGVVEDKDSLHFRLVFDDRLLRVISPYEADIDLYDILGRHRASFRAPEGESRYSLGNLPTGCYLVTVTGRGRRTSVRVILD